MKNNILYVGIESGTMAKPIKTKRKREHVQPKKKLKPAHKLHGDDWYHPHGERHIFFEQHRDPYWHATHRPKHKLGSRFSKKEIMQLGVATLVITLIFGLGFAGVNIFSLFRGDFNFFLVLLFLVVSFLSAGSAFILHELAHKVVAQHYGCWAEFRYNLPLLLGSAALALFLGWFIIIPGAVYHQGYLTNKQRGHVSAAGPATNFILAAFFLAVSIIAYNFLPYGFVFLVGYIGAFINFFIGGFNMIPFGNLDGSKILRWNPLIYIVMAILLIGPALVFLLNPDYIRGLLF